MNLPQNPTAIEFISFMEQVWNNPGTTIYRLCHNAHKTALFIGAKRTGGTTLGGDPACVFRLPSGDKVRITNDGKGVDLVRRNVK